jgi:ABC-type multidrug transport system fused ATPase/permease subunit
MLALLIVINGSLNLLSILGLNRAQETLAAMESKGKNALSRLKKSKDLENGFQEQTKKYLRPLHQVVSETEGHKVVSFVTNLLSVILGVLLLVQANISITVFGLIFIYVGISDFLLAFGTRKIAQKLRDRKFKEILFEETDEHEKSTIEQDPD